ncbi:MAG: hypothetical protein KKB95_22455 [Gammaproteobacteria bacterium]|nr:hypothetical protein [Gammaproteobacteria bacterium]MBU1354635.1 hypothetical protein [Gammaproteobacteria bacterium]MBU1505169.1 hypothetical protein [Gammaproteobacteria bacterium]MBU2118804.1 hypothetical protein [Gammaproteobacteria bacterium]MBU2169750.1 hypothetical protein [Gammaproteobacteria bacterium]
MPPDKDPQPRHETSAPVCFVVVMGQRLLMCIKHGDAPIWRIQNAPLSAPIRRYRTMAKLIQLLKSQQTHQHPSP